MATRTGTHDINTLLAARFQSAKEFGLDNIQEILNAELAAHNELVNGMVADLASPTTDAQNVYGSAVGGTMTEVDEYGAAPTQKVTPGSTVAYPMRLLQFNMGWTLTYFIQATPSDLAIKMVNAQIAHRNHIRYDIQRAIYPSSNFTFVDHLVDDISLTVRRFLNADGEPIPAGPNGEIYDGSTETHYTAEASITNANVIASINSVVEKGHGSRVNIAINLADEAAFSGLSSFTPYVDQRLLQTEGDPRTQLDHTRIDNRAIGILGAAVVWIKPWAVAGYSFVYDAGSSTKPLNFRQPKQTALAGLRLASTNESHPLQVDFMEARYGFGVFQRTNGALHDFGNANYTDPTLTP